MQKWHLRRTRTDFPRASRVEPPSSLSARMVLPPWMWVDQTILKMAPPPHEGRFPAAERRQSIAWGVSPRKRVINN